MGAWRWRLMAACWLAGAVSCAAPPKAGGMVSNSSSPPPVEPPPPSAPPPPPAAAQWPPRIVAPPRARMDLVSLVRDEDYPAPALANREQGTARFTLNVLANGRVGRCVIDRSTGSSALDHATCAILVRRARFTPARDSNGYPAADTFSGSLTWRLPVAGTTEPRQ